MRLSAIPDAPWRSDAGPSLWSDCRSDPSRDPGYPGRGRGQRRALGRTVPYLAQRGLQAREGLGAGRTGRAHRAGPGAPAPPQRRAVAGSIHVVGALPHVLGYPAGGVGGLPPEEGKPRRVEPGRTSSGGWPMTVTDDAAPVLVVRRQMAVPRERVFEAWLDS